MKIKLFRQSRRLFRMLLSSLVGGVIVIIVLMVIELNSRPDLKVWHKTVLEQEFKAESGIQSFAQYLELENRLFEELDELIYQEMPVQDQWVVNRYSKGSIADPGRWPINWNRSFVLPTTAPDAAVLLLHGMSDSPYSLRSAGQLLHSKNAYVIGLRVPGHGQAPSGLRDVEWEDMAAAVRLAMLELTHQSKGKPIYIVGYSNGGALAVQYTLESLSNESLVIPDGLVLMSPEIGISKFAALAVWQERLGHLLGLEKLAWNSLLPEYDPWKYGSFALNAGKQAYRITQEVQKQLTRQAKAGVLDRMPSIIAFQSVVDATVTAPALVQNLFDRLPATSSSPGVGDDKEHELVLFDINRHLRIQQLLKENPTAWLAQMLDRDVFDFTLSVMSNRDQEGQQMAVFSKLPGSSTTNECDTDLSWPDYVYSLSHVALPFSPDDPVYGGVASEKSPGIALGELALRGEKGVLLIPAADMLRLRYNPFYSYMEQRMLGFMGLDPDATGVCQIPETTEGKSAVH